MRGTMTDDLQRRYDALQAYYAAHPDEAREDAARLWGDRQAVGGYLWAALEQVDKELVMSDEQRARLDKVFRDTYGMSKEDVFRLQRERAADLQREVEAESTLAAFGRLRTAFGTFGRAVADWLRLEAIATWLEGRLRR